MRVISQYKIAEDQYKAICNQEGAEQIIRTEIMMSFLKEIMNFPGLITKTEEEGYFKPEVVFKAEAFILTENTMKKIAVFLKGNTNLRPDQMIIFWNILKNEV